MLTERERERKVLSKTVHTWKHDSIFEQRAKYLKGGRAKGPSDRHRRRHNLFSLSLRVNPSLPLRLHPHLLIAKRVVCSMEIVEAGNEGGIALFINRGGQAVFCKLQLTSHSVAKRHGVLSWVEAEERESVCVCVSV